jgi:hypothetical protein
MKKTDEYLKKEIEHMIDSGVNEIRILGLVKREVKQHTAPLIEALEAAKIQFIILNRHPDNYCDYIIKQVETALLNAKQ